MRFSFLFVFPTVLSFFLFLEFLPLSVSLNSLSSILDSSETFISVRLERSALRNPRKNGGNPLDPIELGFSLSPRGFSVISAENAIALKFLFFW